MKLLEMNSLSFNSLVNFVASEWLPIFKFCDTQSLLTLRYVSKGCKKVSDKTCLRWAESMLRWLPFESFSGWITFSNIELHLKAGWSSMFIDEESMADAAIDLSDGLNEAHRDNGFDEGVDWNDVQEALLTNGEACGVFLEENGTVICEYEVGISKEKSTMHPKLQYQSFSDLRNWFSDKFQPHTWIGPGETLDDWFKPFFMPAVQSHFGWKMKKSELESTLEIGDGYLGESFVRKRWAILLEQTTDTSDSGPVRLEISGLNPDYYVE